MRLKFIRNNDNFVIIADKNDGVYKIKLLELYVEFRKIKVDTSVLSREMAALERGEPYVIQNTHRILRLHLWIALGNVH